MYHLFSSFISAHLRIGQLLPSLSIFGLFAWLTLATATVVAQGGEALHFDGADDYVSFPTTGLSASVGTISFWVNSNATQPTNGTMFFDSGNNENTAVFLWNNGSNIIFRAGGVGSQSSFIAYSGGAWMHIAMTWSGVGQPAKGYINGVEVASFNQTGSAGFGSTAYLGRHSIYANGTFNLQGAMDDFRIWNRPLCADEINQLANCEVAPSSDHLQVYFTCNQGTAGGDNTAITALIDDATLIGGANDGSFYHFALDGATSNFVAPGGVTGGACAPTLPEINLQGDAMMDILDGDASPSTSDGTDFGNASVGSPVSATFTIQNTGTEVLNITSITPVGGNTADFAVSGAPNSVAAGDSEDFMVTFTPSATGLRSTTIHIANNDCSESDYDFAVQGTGIGVYMFTGSGNWSAAGNWSANAIPPNPLPAGESIVIDGSGACTMDAAKTVNSGATLTVNAGKTLTISSDLALTNHGEMNIAGIFSKTGASSSFTNSSTGTVVIVSGGAFNNMNGSVSNAGELNNQSGGVFFTDQGNFANSGTFTNSGSHTNSIASWTNTGTFTNAGTFSCAQGTNHLNNGDFTNNGGATITLVTLTNGAAHTLTNNGTLNAGFTNNGDFVNNASFGGGYGKVNAAGATWTNHVGATMTMAGTPFTNAGTFDNMGSFTLNSLSGSASFTNTATGVLNTTGSVSLTPDQNMTNAAGGQINVNGGTFTAFRLMTNSGAVNVGSGATYNNHAGFINNGTLTVSSGGTWAGNGYLTNNATWNHSGVMNVYSMILSNPATGTVNNYGSISIGHNSGSANNAGTWIIHPGGTMNISACGFYNSGSLTNNGTAGLALTNTGTFTNNATFAVSYAGLSNSATGVWTNASGATHSTTGVAFSNAGTFHNDGSFTMNPISGLSSFGNSGTFNSGGTMTLNPDAGSTITATGVMNINGGTCTFNQVCNNLGTLNNYATIVLNTTFKGTGTLVQSGTFINNSGGVIAPGTSPGTLQITGDFNFGSATYQCEVAGTTQGVNYDFLPVSGIATLGGSSKLHLIFSVPINNGTTFEVLSAGDLSGTFGTVTFANTGTGNVTAVSATYLGDNKVRVTVTSPLPVEMVRFSGKVLKDNVLLQWETASERDNEGYYIERFHETENAWKVIGFVAGHGHSVERHSYEALDENPLSGVNYYRLRQQDRSGDFSYSDMVQVEFKSVTVDIYPNPCRPGLVFLDYSSEKTVTLTVTVVHATGARFSSQTFEASKGVNRFHLDMSHAVPGMYWVKIDGNASSLCRALTIR